jgi:hypothetical protein
MWILPLVAAAIALVFAGLLARAFVRRRRPFDALWALAMLMYAVASAVMALGISGGWTGAEYRTYWLLGAVLNVPFLAAGEVLVLIRRRWALPAVVVVLAFVTAYALAVVRPAPISDAALARDLPSGKLVFGDGTPAHRLPQVIAIPAYLVLVGGTIWSALRMRATPEARDRFVGLLALAAGATVIAAVGSIFAAAGNYAAFSISLAVGIAVMFWGFVRTGRPARSTPEMPHGRGAAPSGA